MEILLLASEDRQHSTSELITAPVDTHYNFKKAADEVCRARAEEGRAQSGPTQETPREQMHLA